MKALIIILCIILFFVLLFHIPVSVYLSYADKVLKADIKYFFIRKHAEAGFYDGEFKVIMPEKKEKKQRRRKRRRKKPEESVPDAPGTDAGENACGDTSQETDEEISQETEEEQPEQAVSGEDNAGAEGPDDTHPQFEGIDITYIDDEPGEEPEEEPPEKKFIDEKIEELEKKIDSVLMVWDLNKKYIFRLFGAVRINDVSVNILTAGCDACTAALRYGRANAVVWNIISLTRTFFRVTLLNVDIKCSFDEDEHSKAKCSCVIRLAPSAVISNGAAMAFVTLINLKKIFPDGIGKFRKKK